MDETMNLNGMGIGAGSKPTEAATVSVEVPVETNNELQEQAPVTPESSVVSPELPVEKQESLEANNELDFGDLDMIKELRADEEANRRKNDSIFSNMDFGPLKKYLEDDDVTDISYSNGGQMWLKTLSKGVYRVDERDINDALIEKIAFQCSNVMGKTFNMAHPFLDSESAELRMNFIHDSIARNGIAVVFRKTPAKIRLEKDKLMKENYVSLSIHDFLIKAVQGHCNIIMCGETGSGKTEFLKYLASHTFENEKIVTVEDTLELHLDRIYPHRDIVAMKTNNVASYSDVLVTCMRQNPIWILLSEVRSAEAVTAVRNSISSGHFILSTIHADKAANIPYRLYSLLESNIDVEQFLNTIYRYIQLGVYLRGRFDAKQGRFVREIGEVTEFYVNDNNECVSNTIYQKTIKGDVTYKPISEHLLDYLEGQGMDMKSIREANGDLEKAQSYSDENSEETKKEEVKEENIVVEEKVEIKPEEEKVVPLTTESKADTLVAEVIKPVTEVETVEKIVPITEEAKIDSLVDEVINKPEEPIIPITAEIKKDTLVEEVVKPITETPVTESVIPITQEIKTDNLISEVVKPITEEKPVPITQEVQKEVSTPSVVNNDITSIIENVTPVDSILESSTPVAKEEKIVPITQEINPIPQTITSSPLIDPNSLLATESNEGNNDSGDSFTPINVTSIQ